MNGMRVKCPRCGKIWNVPVGTTDMDCNCHLYCEEGTMPSDCSVTIQNQTIQLGYPTGLHNKPEDEGQDILHRTYYCSTHNRYYYKTPIMIPCDWERWRTHRAPKELRQPMEF